MGDRRSSRGDDEPAKRQSPHETRRSSGARRTRRLGSSDEANSRQSSAQPTRPLLAQHIIWAEYLGDTLTSERSSVNVDVLFAGLLLPTVVPLSWSLAELKRNIFKHIKK